MAEPNTMKVVKRPMFCAESPMPMPYTAAKDQNVPLQQPTISAAAAPIGDCFISQSRRNLALFGADGGSDVVKAIGKIASAKNTAPAENIW